MGIRTIIDKKTIQLTDVNKKILAIFKEIVNNEIIEIGEAQQPEGILARFSDLTEIIHLELVDKFLQIPKQDVILDAPAFHLREGYLDYLYGLLRQNKVKPSAIEAKEVRNPFVVFVFLLNHMVTLALSTEMDAERDGEKLLGMLRVFFERALKEDVLTNQPFIGQEYASNFAKSISETHNVWFQALEEMVKVIKLLHAHSTAFTTTLTQLVQLKKTIQRHLVFELAPDTDRFLFAPEMLSQTLAEIENQQVARIRASEQKKGQIAQASAASSSAQVITQTSTPEKPAQVIMAYFVNNPQRVRCCHLYQLLSDVEKTIWIFEQIDDLLTVAGWLPIMMGIINLESLANMIETLDNSASQILLLGENKTKKRHEGYEGLRLYGSALRFGLRFEARNNVEALLSLGNSQIKKCLEIFFGRIIDNVRQLEQMTGSHIIHQQRLEALIGTSHNQSVQLPHSSSRFFANVPNRLAMLKALEQLLDNDEDNFDTVCGLLNRIQTASVQAWSPEEKTLLDAMLDEQLDITMKWQAKVYECVKRLAGLEITQHYRYKTIKVFLSDMASYELLLKVEPSIFHFNKQELFDFCGGVATKQKITDIVKESLARLVQGQNTWTLLQPETLLFLMKIVESFQLEGVLVEKLKQKPINELIHTLKNGQQILLHIDKALEKIIKAVNVGDMQLLTKSMNGWGAILEAKHSSEKELLAFLEFTLARLSAHEAHFQIPEENLERMYEALDRLVRPYHKTCFPAKPSKDYQQSLNAMLIRTAKGGHNLASFMGYCCGGDIRAFDEEDHHGRTGCHWLVENNQQALLEIVLQRGDIHGIKTQHTQASLLHTAAVVNNPWLIQWLVSDKRHEVNCKTPERQGGDGGGWTPLHAAVNRGNLEAVEALLAMNAEINAFNGDKRTPLHLAAISRNPDMVTLLLRAGAEQNIDDINGKKAIDYANETVKVAFMAPMNEESGGRHVRRLQ